MTNQRFHLSGPYTHDNLTIRLIHGADTFDAWTVAGAAIIVGSTLYITIREASLARQARS